LKHDDRSEAIRILGGTSLKVYLLLASSKEPLGVREVQRRMGFRSPSTAKHHLDRLVELGLAERREGGYAARTGPEGIFEGYTRMLGSLVPRLLPYAVFVTATLVIYALMSWPNIDPGFLLIGCIAASLLWFEGLRMALWLRRLMK